MYKKIQPMNPIVDHIVDVYGFEITPCSIPSSGFQYLKRDFYIFLMDCKLNRLSFFLRNKVSSIKFLKERPNGSFWLRKRMGTLCEIEVTPVPAETMMYIPDGKGIFKVSASDNYKITIHYGEFKTSEFYKNQVFIPHVAKGSECKTFPVNFINTTSQIDAHFSDIPELKMLLREYKLNQLCPNHQN